MPLGPEAISFDAGRWTDAGSDGGVSRARVHPPEPGSIDHRGVVAVGGDSEIPRLASSPRAGEGDRQAELPAGRGSDSNDGAVPGVRHPASRHQWS